MGKKISIDSSTLMNKALEIIEAKYLFGIEKDKIEAIIHPEGLVHSFVEFVDGTTLASMAKPDMKIPISYGLGFPKLILSSGQIDIRDDVNQRICNIINNLKSIDSDIDQAMVGWRLKRLPRIDRDILRLAYVDINFLNTPIAVACDEAVNLANKYSDLQGRKFINGVLRRLQTI